MTAVIVLAAIAAVFIAIGFVRLRVSAEFKDGLRAEVKFLWKTIVLFPKQKKADKVAKKSKKPKEVTEKDLRKAEAKKAKKEARPSFIRRLGGAESALELLIELIVDLFGIVYTDILRVKFVSAKLDDPATAAKNYGYAWAAAGIIIPLLENNPNFKRHDIDIWLDYEAEKPEVEAELVISVSVGRTMRYLVSKGCKILKIMFKNRKKGGKKYGKAGQQYA